MILHNYNIYNILNIIKNNNKIDVTHLLLIRKCLQYLNVFFIFIVMAFIFTKKALFAGILQV